MARSVNRTNRRFPSKLDDLINFFFTLLKRRHFGRYKTTFQILHLEVQTIEVIVPNAQRNLRRDNSHQWLGNLAKPPLHRPLQHRIFPPYRYKRPLPFPPPPLHACYKASTRPTSTNSCKGLIF